MSKYCKEIADKYEIRVGDVKKLIPNLGNKTKYVLHYKILQLYLSLGMKLTKIHRVLKFKQSDWMKKYTGWIKPVLILNQPIYVGFIVLELNRWLMYDFHYNFIKKNFDVELLFTDTDSLAYEIKSEDVYEEFFKQNYLFDFSNFLKDSKFFNEANKKVIGKMKDEFVGVILEEFVGLKSKMYSMKKKWWQRIKNC